MPKWTVWYYTASACGSCDDCGPSPVTDESMGGKAGHRGVYPYAPCTRQRCSTTSSTSHVYSTLVKWLWHVWVRVFILCAPACVTSVLVKNALLCFTASSCCYWLTDVEANYVWCGLRYMGEGSMQTLCLRVKGSYWADRSLGLSWADRIIGVCLVCRVLYYS